MSARYKLRLLNGPLMGSEVQLPNGEWKIGGSSSDFAVTLERDAQATLQIDDEGVHLAGDAPYWVNGRRGRYPAGPLPLRTPVEIAGLGLVVATVDDELPTFTMPRRRSAKRRALVLCGLAGLLIVVAGLAGGAILILPPNFRPPPDNVDALVSSIARRLAPDGVRIEHKGNVVMLGGACVDRDQVELARRDLVKQGVSVIDEVVCEDDLLRSVTGVLQLYGIYGVQVRPDTTPGYVVFAGNLSSDPRWAAVAKVLASTPGLLGWRVSDPAIDATGALAAKLRAAGILDNLSVFRSGEVILVTGLLDPPGKARLDAIFAAFRAEHRQGPRVVYQDIAPYIPLDKIFPTPLVAIGGNSEQAFAMLQSGDRLQVGDIMSSGYRITGIHRDGVDVERNGEFVHAPVRANSR